MREPLAPGCVRVQARLALLVDDELAALDAARDRGHLEACRACRLALARHEQLLARIREAATAGAARDAAEVNAELLRRSASWPRPRPRRSSRRLGTAATVAAAVLVLLRLVLGGRDLPQGLEMAGLEPLMEHLPSWSQVVEGVGQLARWIG